SKRRSTLPRRSDYFLHVLGFGGGEDFHQLGNQRSGHGAAGGDGGELTPERGITAKVGNQGPSHRIGDTNGHNGGKPHQRGQRRFEVHFFGFAEPQPGDDLVDVISGHRRNQHGHTHRKQPHQKFNGDSFALCAQNDERDQRHLYHAVGLEPVRRGANRIAGIVSGAVGNHAGITGVVFLHVENNLHQVGANVGDLGEDAAGKTQRGRAQRFADGKADKARPGVISRNKENNAEHHQQLDGDEHHADAHAGLKRNAERAIRIAAQRSPRAARIGQRIHPDSEPGHEVAARHAQYAESQNNDHPQRAEVKQYGEVNQNDDRDE